MLLCYYAWKQYQVVLGSQDNVFMVLLSFIIKYLSLNLCVLWF